MNNYNNYNNNVSTAVPSRDLLLAQASTDGVAIDGSRSAIDG